MPDEGRLGEAKTKEALTDLKCTANRIASVKSTFTFVYTSTATRHMTLYHACMHAHDIIINK